MPITRRSSRVFGLGCNTRSSARGSRKISRLIKDNNGSIGSGNYIGDAVCVDFVSPFLSFDPNLPVESRLHYLTYSNSLIHRFHVRLTPFPSRADRFINYAKQIIIYCPAIYSAENIPRKLIRSRGRSSSSSSSSHSVREMYTYTYFLIHIKHLRGEKKRIQRDTTRIIRELRETNECLEKRQTRISVIARVRIRVLGARAAGDN